MAVHPDRALHPLRLLHALGCLGLALAFGRYAWQHHPARGLLRPREHPVAPRGMPSAAMQGFSDALVLRLNLVRVILPDGVGGLGVLLLFSVGTGIYVRRFEVWLEAHQAGEAAAIRGVGLDQAALGANKDRKKGATL